MSRWIPTLTALFLLPFQSGCFLFEECDPDTDPDCAGPSDTDIPSTGQPSTGTPTGTVQIFRYLAIEDWTADDYTYGSGTAGADIVAIELVKGGQKIHASELHGCGFGALDNSAASDCSQALGPPDGGIGICDTSGSAENPDFVSLGGVGGRLIVSFPDDLPIDTGDQIIVYECGTDQNPAAVEEPFSVLVGDVTDPAAGTWLTCLSFGTGISSCTVPAP